MLPIVKIVYKFPDLSLAFVSSAASASCTYDETRAELGNQFRSINVPTYDNVVVDDRERLQCDW